MPIIWHSFDFASSKALNVSSVSPEYDDTITSVCVLAHLGIV